MNENVTGQLIRTLRLEAGLTQKELADKMFLSDKAISKWERGLGLPDVSVLTELASIFNVSIEVLLNGENTDLNVRKNGIKRTSFYVCDKCDNVVFASNTTNIICCDKKLSPLIAQEEDADHHLEISEVDGSNLITINHPVDKSHSIKFMAIKKGTSLNIIPLYPEWEISIREDDLKWSRLYYYCNNHGLFSKQIK